MSEERGGRLNRYMARCGAGSRRACDELIRSGRVTVNRKVVSELGTRIDPASDDVRLDGERLRPARPVYVMINKPGGVVCSRNAQGDRPRLDDLIGERFENLHPVGRLDEDSTGLVVMTNDGELTQRISHPSAHVSKTYRVVVKGEVGAGEVARLREGIWLAEGKARLEGIEVVERTRERTTFEVRLHEGRNRQIRRLFAHVGHPVQKLERIRIGSLELGSLTPGRYRVMNESEVRQMFLEP